jgi:2-methylisocitrate lyase-like PEP mutase family enzyme
MNVIEQQAMTPAVGTSERAPDFSRRRRAFRLLHDTGCFVIPNPWDVGSARYLQQLGFPALATTSAGFAFSQGCQIPNMLSPATGT